MKKGMSWHFLVKLEAARRRGRDTKVLNLDIVVRRGGRSRTEVLVWRDKRDGIRIRKGSQG